MDNTYGKKLANQLLYGQGSFDSSDLLRRPEDGTQDFVASQQDPLANLPDKGYVPPTEEQMKSPGFQDASKFLSNNEPIVGKQAADLLEQYKQQKSPEVRMTASESTEQNPIANKESILEQYKKLMKKRQDNNQTFDMMAGGNKIAQAIASGYGAKIDDGSDIVKGLKDSAKLPEEALLGQSKAADTQNELELVDPNSDISKFARERAIAYAKKAGMSEETVQKLESLSAKQLEKLGMFKATNTDTSKLGLYYTTIRDENGQDRVVGIDRSTGKVVADIGGKTYADKIVENKQTGQNQVYKQGAGVSSLNTGTSTTPEEIQKKQTETKKEYETPQSLNKVNPNLYKDFKKTQDEFNKDMKDSREAASAATALSEKLKPGANGEVDSGTLGGIQTQTAKLSGQKGVLTDQDLVKFAGAGGVQASLDRIIDGSMFGNMSEQDIKFFKAFSKKMGKYLQQDINNRSQLFIKQTHNEAKEFLPNLSEQDVAKWLQVDSVAPFVQTKMIKVMSPEGKIGSIPEQNLDKAIKKGFKKVD
jgi:hypothetical protein